MSAHVYECDKSELGELKKMLAYDPYLDPNVIPVSREPEKNVKPDKDLEKAIEERDKLVKENLEKLQNDKYGNVIFARQEFEIFDGAALNIDTGKYYLYLKASDEFLQKADDKLEHSFKTVKRASKDIEDKVVKRVEDEEENANVGFGSIFG